MSISNARILCIEDYSESCRLISQLLFTEKHSLDFAVTHSPAQRFLWLPINLSTFILSKIDFRK